MKNPNRKRNFSPNNQLSCSYFQIEQAIWQTLNTTDKWKKRDWCGGMGCGWGLGGGDVKKIDSDRYSLHEVYTDCLKSRGSLCP